MTQPTDNLPSPANLAFVESIYEAFVADPTSVSEDWREYFRQTEAARPATAVGPAFASFSLFNPPSVNGAATASNGAQVNGAAAHAPVKTAASKGGHSNGTNGSARNAALATAVSAAESQMARPARALTGADSLYPESPTLEIAIRQDRVDQLVRAYRVRGHMIANIDPLGMPRPDHRELEAATYNLDDDDLGRTFSTCNIYVIT